MTATTILSDNGVTSGSSGYKLDGGNDGTLQLRTTTTGGTATTAVTIDNSQNVGIGTSSPAVPLHVASTGAYQARFERTSAANSYITFKGTSTVGNNGIGTSGDNVSLITGGTERAVIDSSGNVGIGTATMTRNFNVGGSNTAVGLNLNNTGTSGRSYSIFSTNNGASTVGSLGFYDDTAGAYRMVLDSSGNLLVGTTSGASSFKQSLYAPGFSTNGLAIGTTDNASGFIFASFRDNTNTTIGSITRTGTTSVVTYNTSSDYRLKENIQPMIGALAKVAALKPVTYTWKADGSAGQGFIAHELQEVVPDCVTGKKDAVDAEGNPVYQGIDTSFLVATLTAAIQEQQAIIQQLTARIETLEAK